MTRATCHRFAANIQIAVVYENVTQLHLKWTNFQFSFFPNIAWIHNSEQDFLRATCSAGVVRQSFFNLLSQGRTASTTQQPSPGSLGIWFLSLFFLYFSLLPTPCFPGSSNVSMTLFPPGGHRISTRNTLLTPMQMISRVGGKKRKKKREIDSLKAT